MKFSNIYLLILLTFTPCILLGQATATIGFKNQQEIIEYNVSDTLQIPYTIEITGRVFPEKADGITLTIITNFKELNTYLVDNTISISQSTTQGKLKFYRKKELKRGLKSLTDSIFKQDGFITLKIEPFAAPSSFNSKGTSINLTIENDEKTISLREKKGVTNKKYNFYIGTNFDLKDNFKTNSFYSEIDVFLPGIFFQNIKGNNWGGLRAGIYKNNIKTTQREYQRDTVIYEITEDNAESDSITLEKKLITRTPTTSFNNLGFYAELLMRVYKSEDSKFQAFLAPHAEVIQRTETTSFESDNSTTINRSVIPRDSLESRNVRLLISRNRDRTVKYYNTYFGAGLPMKFLNDDIEIFLNPVLGYGDSALLGNRNESGNLFGIFQFHLMERNHGIKISGEVRKYFNARQDPLMVLNVSKSFNLDTLLDSNKDSTN